MHQNRRRAEIEIRPALDALPEHPPLKMSPMVSWRDHAIFPVFKSSASTASLVAVAGGE